MYVAFNIFLTSTDVKRRAGIRIRTRTPIHIHIPHRTRTHPLMHMHTPPYLSWTTVIQTRVTQAMGAAQSY